MILKTVTIIIFSSILFGCGRSTNNQSKEIDKTDVNSKGVTDFKPVETIIIDLNDDNLLDTIILTTPSVEGDPGQFGKIILRTSNAGRHVFTARDIWDFVDTAFQARNKNAIKSDRVFVYKHENETEILLFGFQYGSGREEFSIIRITNDKVAMIFDNALQDIIQISDLNNDGKPEFVGRNVCDEVPDNGNSYIEGYCPFLVYTIDSDCKLSEVLSKTYNEENYVWAGLKYSEKIKVIVQNDGSKARIVK